MAVTDMHLPAACADGQHIAPGNPRIAQRQGCHAIGKVERALKRPRRQQIGVHPCRAPEGHLFGAGQRLFVQNQHACHQPGGAGCQQVCALRLEPAGKADMVGVVVCGDHARHRPPGQRPVQQPLPDCAAAAAVHAGVDDGPAGAIVQRIDIHVVQRHRQRQAHPQDAGGHLYRLTLAGGCFEGGAKGQGGIGHAARSSGDTANSPSAPSRACARRPMYSGIRRRIATRASGWRPASAIAARRCRCPPRTRAKARR